MSNQILVVKVGISDENRLRPETMIGHGLARDQFSR